MAHLAQACLHISSSYAKILGEKLFRTWEIPRSGSKAEDGEKKKKKKGAKVGDNNGQATHGARRHAWRMQAAWAKRKKDGTMVITMASYALQRHLVWRTQSCLGQLKRKNILQRPLLGI